jgi:hypothetical protein
MHEQPLQHRALLVLVLLELVLQLLLTYTVCDHEDDGLVLSPPELFPSVFVVW